MSKMGSLSRFVKENGGDAKRVFIVPNNDLESVVITEMLKDAGYKEGIDFFVTNQSCGASWEGVEFDIWERIAEQHGDGLIEFAKRNNEERFYQNAKAVDVTEYLFESTSQNFDELIQRLMNSSYAMQQSDFFLTRCPDSIDEIQKMIEEYYNDGGQAEVYVAQTELGWVFSYTTVSGKNSVSLNYIEPSEKQDGGYGLQYFAKSYNPPEKSGIVKSCIENGFEFVSTPEQNLFLSRISDVRNDLFQKYWDELNGVQSNKSTSKIIRPVELVGVELKGSIRDIFPSGCIVSTNVDHHNKSSLEQIADMLGRKLTVYEGFVAANDRSFVDRDNFDLLMDENNNFVPNSNGYDKDEDNLGEEI